MINKFKEWYQEFETAKWNAFARKHFPDHKFVIEPAFEVAGMQYFRFSDTANQPFERGLWSLAFYEEVRCRIDRDYLLEHTKAITDILREKTIDVFKINMLNEQMKERLELAMDVDLMYKLASVVFFDKNENPVLYDFAYNQKKIEFWKKHIGVHSFFLQKPLQELMPFLQTCNIDLETYSELNSQINEIHLERIRACQSKSS